MRKSGEMQYIGGKQRIAKYICPILQKELDTGFYDGYVEPFVGGGNVVQGIDYPIKLCYDNNKWLIALWNYVTDGGKLPDILKIDKDEYMRVWDSFKKQDGRYEDWYYAYVGFLCSFSARWWGSFARGSKTEGGTPYNKEKQNNLEKQIPKMLNCKFEQANYKDLSFKNKVIYCDPPYVMSSHKYYKENFDIDEFWNWVREQSKWNKVFVSECNVPDDMTIVWQKECKAALNASQKTMVEKLVTYDR